MDDDFNVIDNCDDETLAYPEDGPTEEAAVLTELNGIGKRVGKRRLCEMLDELPPDSHPIDWHMRMPLSLEEREAKRHKQLLEDEIMERLTTKIVEARARRSGTGIHNEHEDDLEEEENRKQQIMDSPPIDGSHWLGVSSDGNEQRFYVRLIKHRPNQISTSIYSRDLALASLDHVVREAEELREKMRDRMLESARESEESFMEEETVQSPLSAALWVDKYSPRTYADLVSDDAVNRNLLTWLKLWDECVFRRRLENVTDMVPDSEKEVYCLDSGKIRRPVHKILLLSGPAGLGKTTLAKIVAKNAGYSTVEVNASDSRNVADFDRILEGAVRSSRTIDGNGLGRPNCLIIDEIDGAPIDSIRFLVKAVQATGKKMIRRPIICICNNLFTRALRELRPVALSVVMQPPKEERLADRLYQICNLENLRADHSALRRLVQWCNHDIRLAVNALQFASATHHNNRGGNCITQKDLEEAVQNENMDYSSVFDGWSAILEYSKHVDNKRILLNESRRIRAIERIAIDAGDERFVSGLHWNYLNLPLPIGTLHKAALTFLFHDRINRLISETQNFSVKRYEIAFFALLHLTVATHHKIALTYPQLEQNMALRHKESMESLTCVRSQMSCRRTTSDLIRDVIPFTVAIVQPPIKPMNEQLYSKRDRQRIDDVVKVMHSFNMTYVPAVVNSQTHFVFQPSVDVLTMFNLSDVSHRVCLPSSVRQMIARQVEVYRIRSVSHESENIQQKGRPRLPSLAEIRRPSKPVALYFHYNPGVSSAVKKNVRLCNVFP